MVFREWGCNEQVPLAKNKLYRRILQAKQEHVCNSLLSAILLESETDL